MLHFQADGLAAWDSTRPWCGWLDYVCLFLCDLVVVFCVKTPGDDEESVRGKSEGQDAWVPRHDTVPGAGGSQCSGTED